MNYSLIKTAIEPELGELDALISNCVTENSSTLINSISQYIFNSGGKRIRPVIFLIMAKMFDYKGYNHIRLAAVLEIIHTATLLHDDVIDNSGMRRNKVSAHIKWGTRNSITVGDWLFSLAFKLTVSCNDLNLTRIIAKMTKDMAAGELNQLYYKLNSNIDEGSYFAVIEAKTGLLFSAATELAACLVNQSEQNKEYARLFGLHLGYAFQIKDDLLDYMGDVNKTGKNIGDDLLDEKLTLPMIYLRQRDKNAFNKFMSSFKAYKKDNPNITDLLEKKQQGFNHTFLALKEKLEEHHCILDSNNKAKQHQQLALEYLDKLPGLDKYKNYLLELTSQVVARSH